MKHLFNCTVLAGCILAPPASADIYRTTVEVPVVAVEPIVRMVTEKIPHEACWDERIKVVQAGASHSATPAILGAIIGGATAGALGHNSHHQPVIVGAGAVLGASVGHDVSHSRNNSSRYVTERRCEVDYELRDREHITGYRVSYRYGDTIYHTRTETHPGPSIKLRVELEPIH